MTALRHESAESPRLSLGTVRRRSIYGLFAGLFVSGILFWWLDGTRQDHAPGALQLMTIRLHGGLAMLALIYAGTLVYNHVLPGWRLKRSRVTGVGLVSTVGVLSLSAWGLYYGEEGGSRSLANGVHWVFGLVLLPLLGLHIVHGRSTRRRQGRYRRARH